MNILDLYGISKLVENLQPRDLALFIINQTRIGVDFEVARELVARAPDLSTVEESTGFTVFHVAAAVGRKDLFDLFASVATPSFDQKDKRGWTPVDLAGMVGDDIDLVKHIYDLHARHVGIA